MNRRKPNITLWYSLGLAVLLCVAFLVVATGTTLARYRAEREAEITFEVREPEQICLGTVRTVTEEEATEDLKAGTEVFDASTAPVWENVENVPQITFAVANGTSATDYSQRDQKLQLRLIGTLGFWTGEGTANMYLLLPAEDGTDTVNKIQATVTPIPEGTVLHQTNGDGWIYTFQDVNKEELSWTLSGGELSYISLTVTMEGAVLSDPSLLQLQMVADVIRE